jgi:hypothetical protein
MSYQFGPRDSSSELLQIIRQVRRRWRNKLALRGALGVVGIGLLVLVLSALGLESWRFTPGAIITFRIILGVALAGLVGYLFVWPLMRSASDEQVALYLEEHEPSLQAAIISAVEAGRGDAGSPYSATLVRKLVESAVDRCKEIESGRRVERVPVRRYALTLAALAIGAIALFGLGPAYLRHALSALFVLSRDVLAAAPYRIAVTPGNATVPRGADQTITAQLSGFDAEQASLLVRKTPEAAFERLALLRGDDGKYEGMLFDLAAPISYFVEANGVRSDVFTLKVIDLPYVQRLELEYHFPAYTGLPPQKVEDGGDIAVLKGTEVRVRALPTMQSPGGQIVLSDTERSALAPAAEGGSPAPLTGKFKVDKDGFYRIELDAPSGERVPGSPQYTIDVLADQPPTVSISKPGRDTSASPIEEVFVEARADDDFGVRDLDLVYSVNGGTEKTIRLFDGKKRLSEVSAGHTFYLEELDVKAGDFVSYYAKAADNDGVQGPKPAMSDMYFVRVRPLSKEFRRAPSDAGGGGGGGGGQQNQVGALSEQQRQIIAATFNVQRDRKKMTADKVRENSIVIALSQSRLREQVDGLLTRMNSRLVEQDPAFKKVAELLPQAVTEMKAAESKLQAVNPQAALEPEQKALQHLQRAEEEYEMQVQIQRQQGGGGGGGGASAMAQDLADLFEMELDKMANQYESRQQASQQQSDQKLDELMEKLKDLARRQEQEAERQRRRAALGQQASGGSGQQQRDLADQAEEAARRLEQLSREENRPELMQSARQLREAADAMRKAAANGQQGGGAQAAAALERLKEAERRLQQTQSGRAERDVQNALQQAEELAREQQEIANGVKGLDSAGDRRQDKTQQLIERKTALEQKVGELENQLDRSARDLRAQEKEAARKLAEGAESIRNDKVRDKINYSSRMVREGAPQTQQQAMEGSIGSSLESLKSTLGQAASALGKPSQADAMGQALERARQLARGVDSLDQRMRERQQRQQGRQGQSGQPGQQGQEGQQGQAGQQGQQGQRGQEGQQGQAGQQGQQGQRGQGQQGQQSEGQQGQQGQGQQGQQGQGQQGQQGQGQQGGQGGNNDGSRTQDGRLGNGDTTGRFNDNGGGFGDRRPGRFDGRFDPDDVRQFRGEARQFVNDAQQLRRMIQGQGVDARALEEVLRNLRALDDDRVYQDSATLERLQSAVSEGMKRFEFNLRRQAEAKSEVFLSGSDNVPEEYRKLVEQYYKSLSKGPGKEEQKSDKKDDRQNDPK